MSKPEQSAFRRNLPSIIGILVFLAVVVIISMNNNVSVTGSTIPVITSESDYKERAQMAQKLSQGPLIKHSEGQPLDEADKETLKQARDIFIGLAAYRQNNFANYVAIGLVDQALESWQSSVDNLELALTHAPAQPEGDTKKLMAEALSSLALGQYMLKDYADAAASVQRSIALEPENPKYHTDLAMVYAEQRQYVAAKKALDEALKLDPDYGRAKQLLRLVNSELEP